MQIYEKIGRGPGVAKGPEVSYLNSKLLKLAVNKLGFCFFICRYLDYMLQLKYVKIEKFVKGRAKRNPTNA